jgi:hypothetical protein
MNVYKRLGTERQVTLIANETGWQVLVSWLHCWNCSCTKLQLYAVSVMAR